MPAIYFFTEDISFSLSAPEKTIRWIKKVIRSEDRKLNALNFVFCSDKYLLKLNQEYLQHDEFTDIITFDNSEADNILLGDIFISIERVQDNARKLAVSLDQEIHRVMIHGVLHLLGYNDKSNKQRKQMREKEDAYLSLLPI